MFETFRADLRRAAAPGPVAHDVAPEGKRRQLMALVDQRQVWAIAEFRFPEGRAWS